MNRMKWGYETDYSVHAPRPAYRFSNRLIPGVGLAISVYDILTCSEGTVRYGDGLIWYKSKSASPEHTKPVYIFLIIRLAAVFRTVVFAPTVGEIMLGKIVSSSKEHVRGQSDTLANSRSRFSFQPELFTK
jgi:hypothetical protein